MAATYRTTNQPNTLISRYIYSFWHQFRFQTWNWNIVAAAAVDYYYCKLYSGQTDCDAKRWQQHSVAKHHIAWRAQWMQLCASYATRLWAFSLTLCLSDTDMRLIRVRYRLIRRNVDDFNAHCNENEEMKKKKETKRNENRINQIGNTAAATKECWLLSPTGW